MSEFPKRKTILCIDDDNSVLEYHKALLERRGYDVLTAASPLEGLQIAAACGIAAVVVDYHMPEMNGHEVAIEIKRITPRVPIIMVSSDNEVSEYVLNVVDAFVSKDETASRLLPVIVGICGESHAGFPESSRVPA